VYIDVPAVLQSLGLGRAAEARIRLMDMRGD
jgi:hypothetical protein